MVILGALVLAWRHSATTVEHHKFKQVKEQMSHIPVTFGPNVTAFDLKARQFFVSYHGVLTLAYDGWTAEALALKVRSLSISVYTDVTSCNAVRCTVALLARSERFGVVAFIYTPSLRLP